MKTSHAWVFCSPVWEADRGRYRSLIYKDDGGAYGFALWGPRPDEDRYRERHHAMRASRDRLLNDARQVIDALNGW